MRRSLLQGPGWRLGWNPEAKVYSGLVGDDHWAVELTFNEFADLRRLSNQLVSNLQAIADELMEEESIELEAESEHIWVALEGFATSYSLRFILLGDRGSEGGWSETATPGFLQALAGIEL
jgi:Domain of unknown function (DUF1818)